MGGAAVWARRRSLWKRLRRATRGPRNWLLARAIAVVATVVGALPVSLALALGRALGRAAHVVLATPRRLARRHVALAFPELGPADRAALVRATFVHAGQSYAELALWPRLRHTDYVVVAGEEHVRAALAGGGGAVVITGHCGNWELLAAVMAERGWPLSVVARRVHDPRFDALVRRFRSERGMEILDRDAASFQSAVRAALGRNRLVCVLMDQDTRGAGLFVPFFGRLAHTPPGAAIIAVRNQVPVLSAFIRRRPGGGHRVTVRPVPVERVGRPRERIATLTARCTAEIELAIRRAPAEWVWWHERWRRQPGD